MQWLRKKTSRSRERMPKVIQTSVATHQFSPGDLVRIERDAGRVRKLQEEYGGFSSQLMGPLLGKVVKVKHCKQDGVNVEYEGKDHDFNPELLTKIHQHTNDRKDQLDLHISTLKANIDIQILEEPIYPLETEPEEKENSVEINLQEPPKDSYEPSILLVNNNTPAHLPSIAHHHPSCPHSTIPIPPQSLEQEKLRSSANQEIIQQIMHSDLPRNPLECKVCYDRIINTRIDCGHTFCHECTNQMIRCPVCKKDIYSRVPIYFG